MRDSWKTALVKQLPTKGIFATRLVTLGWVIAQGILVSTPAIAQAQNRDNPLTYSQLLKKIDDGEVEEVDIDETQRVARVRLEGQKKGAPMIEVPILERNPELLTRLQDRKNIKYDLQRTSDNSAVIGVVANLLLFILLIAGLLLILRRSTNSPGGPGQAMSFGKSRARFSMEAKTGVLFDDVAGIEEAKEELQEVVTFLKKPERFTAVGARIPKGVLLVGPPGTGKTLLAKAIAGEAGVPFFSISGSEFVEMFVGVGASRVRDLFKKAKENAPCIVFIDEIDAVGRQRGTGIGGGNDEREQTLNQLLTEMDGFEGNTGIIIIAATNRPDVLDTALLRPGRFDRQVIVDLPSYKGRLGILEVHARNKKLAPEISLEAIARRTPGFSGADLANLLNESAILTARRRKEAVTMLEVDDALDRLTIGLKLVPRIDGKVKWMTAYHEVGHALVATMCKHASPVDKVTIIPRSGGVEGFTSFLPDEDMIDSEGLLSRAVLIDRITVALGGRAAEVEIYGADEIDAGAVSDIKSVTNLARKMVTMYGMSDLGALALEAPSHDVFLGRGWSERADYSEEVAAKIDRQVRAIACHGYEEARRIIRADRALIDRLVEVLLEQETIDGEEFRKLVTAFHEGQPQAISVSASTT